MKNDKRKVKKSDQAVNAWHERDSHIHSDIMGSYTGTPKKDKLHTTGEKPEQDSDDI